MDMCELDIEEAFNNLKNSKIDYESFKTGVKIGYAEGYKEGYDCGHQEGYEEGYDAAVDEEDD